MLTAFLRGFPADISAVMEKGRVYMKLRDMLNGMKILSSACDYDAEVGGIECDSRKVMAGSVFVAIRGFETDGNKYTDAALKAGAVAVITDDRNTECEKSIVVEDARIALAEAARNFYGNPLKGMKVIGVTGTNGKTTVTHLIKKGLEHTGAVCGLIGTNRNMIGDKSLETERTTPESYELWKLFREMRDAGCTHVIMEVSSHSIALSRVHGIKFDVGVFTNLSQDHLDFHGTMEEYEKVKSEMFKNCEKGVVNYDDDAGKRIIQNNGISFVTYSAVSNSADYVAKNIRYKPSTVEFELVGIDTIGRIEMNIPGKFSVYNGLAAASTLLTLGIPLHEIAAALRALHGVKGRAEVVPTPADYTVMIDYAHSPDGLYNVLSTVKGVTEGRVIVVFGCGGDRDRTKRPKMGAVAAEKADVVIITSDNPRCEDPDLIISDIVSGVAGVRSDYEVRTDRREAIFHALDIAQKGDIIVLAGKGHETYQEINHIKYHMDEREIVAEYFSGR